MTQAIDWDAFNDGVVDDFRAHQGTITQGRFAGRKLMLLTTIGAKSGAPRVAPLAFTRDGDNYVVIASKGGLPTNPDWYHNLVANPRVTVEVGNERFEALARVAQGGERDRLYAAAGRLDARLRRVPAPDNPPDSRGRPGTHNLSPIRATGAI